MSSKESQFLMSMQNIEEYRGKWVAILDNQIIASGPNIADVYKDALKKAGKRTPLFHRIPRREEAKTLIL